MSAAENWCVVAAAVSQGRDCAFNSSESPSLTGRLSDCAANATGTAS